jgi:hypothetical protein
MARQLLKEADEVQVDAEAKNVDEEPVDGEKTLDDIIEAYARS